MSESGFDFVDLAIGGPHHRNHVVHVGEVPTLVAKSAGVDCFTSVLRFTEDLARYAATNPSPTTGKPPSVSGYPGAALAVSVPFDFDDQAEPARALADTRTLVYRLHDDYDVPAEALYLAFSGMKGISVGLPGVLFGGFEPSVDVHERLGRVARELTVGLATVDLGIYDKLRLWRIPNTRHRKTELYKIRLTAEELLRLSFDQIRVLARAPRKVELPKKNELQPSESLVALWKEIEKRETTGTRRNNAAGQRVSAGEWADLLRSGIPKGRIQTTLWRVAAHLRGKNVAPPVIQTCVHALGVVTGLEEHRVLDIIKRAVRRQEVE